jgi:hypothetical protein
MCDIFPDKPKTPKPQVVVQSAKPAPAPQKTDADIQKDTEKDRLRRAYSSRGLPSLVLTGGLGDTSNFQTGGVTLGRL